MGKIGLNGILIHLLNRSDLNLYRCFNWGFCLNVNVNVLVQYILSKPLTQIFFTNGLQTTSVVQPASRWLRETTPNSDNPELFLLLLNIMHEK